MGTRGRVRSPELKRRAPSAREGDEGDDLPRRDVSRARHRDATADGLHGIESNRAEGNFDRGRELRLLSDGNFLVKQTDVWIAWLLVLRA